MLLTDIHPLYGDHLRFLEEKASVASLWQTEMASVTQRGRRGFSTADDALHTLHDMQRLRQIYLAGLENTSSFRDAYDRARLFSWPDFTSPPVEDELQKGLAAQIYNAKAGDRVIFQVSNGARRVGQITLDACLSNNIQTAVQVTDENFRNLVLNHANEQGVDNVAADFLALTAPATKRIAALAGQSDETPIERDAAKDTLFTTLTNPFQTRLRTGELFYTLTIIPTPKDAETDGMNFVDYSRLFFETCHQPWPYIDRAQDQFIERELNPGKRLRFTNGNGTNLSMDIEGFTFCNSVVGKNVPGSEMFSAPRRDSVNGWITSHGIFAPPYEPDNIIKNLVMGFEKGRLTKWHADSGQHHFERTIGIDDGAKYVGEIGIGTNPHLRRHVANPLLVEKVSGSFHIALGDCYKFRSYADRPVTVDNGNQSKRHWDITTLLGDMYIDNRKVMYGGYFINPAYNVLNRGWAAVPEAEWPDYWKNHPTVLANTARL